MYIVVDGARLKLILSHISVTSLITVKSSYAMHLSEQPTHIDIGSYMSIKHTVCLCPKLFIAILAKLALVKDISSFNFFF